MTNGHHGERIILGPDCLAEGGAVLAARDPRLAAALERVGPLPLRLRPDGFGALVDAIVGQQVSVAAAAAIRGRMMAAGLDDPARLAQADEAACRAAGLSRAKAAALRAIAAADVDFTGLRALPSDAVVARLVTLPGVGRWTAEIYAMFALGRADVLAAGDLALQEGARLLFGLPARPNEATLRAMARDWAPWRAVAARLLWAYYRVERQREGIG